MNEVMITSYCLNNSNESLIAQTVLTEVDIVEMRIMHQDILQYFCTTRTELTFIEDHPLIITLFLNFFNELPNYIMNDYFDCVIGLVLLLSIDAFAVKEIYDLIHLNSVDLF